MTLHNLAITITLTLAVSTNLLAISTLQYSLSISLTKPQLRHLRKFLAFAISGTPRSLLALARLIDHLAGRIDQHSPFEVDVTLTGVVDAVVWSGEGVGMGVLGGLVGRYERERERTRRGLDGERGLAATWV
ncbi:hypothetical protein M409DRAFT_28273 [Zasmidium cellare ATCC 36951]|uniref:Uncharacterized protein n=1 Tax=Zasmidium cellare ATCC 36951 TaxID=1080233 RepID=A0A6A6C2B6_ZASCE|nr:uncharacterized protein M409DRAFT_28273 [Zasmidium cellare ATCC 36951]KAF2161234.1 hypothetical protein M409DRAFT_28273 [Zasmidium cellare ATCC 36951]